MSAPSSYCLSLRCRACGHEHPLEPVGVCSRCFGPLEPVYDKEALRRELSRESIEAGPPSLWRYARAPPGHARGRAAARARPDAARRGPSARIGTRRRNALPQARHGESDSLLQGPRGGRGVREGARARSDHARVLVDGQPRERGRGPRGRRGHRGRRPLPGEPRAREADRDRRLRRDDLRRRRHVRRLQQALGRALLRARLGVRQRRPSLVLRRGLEDARLRGQPSSSAGSSPTRSSPRSRPAPCSRRCTRGSASCASSASSKERLLGSTAGRPKAARRSRRRSPRTGG